jgi:trimethylamine:corrinoid methyltransferase-like protein
LSQKDSITNYNKEHTMQPRLSLLDHELIARIIDEACLLMITPGIKVQNAEARALLAEAGALVDEETTIVKIPRVVVRRFSGCSIYELVQIA